MNPAPTATHVTGPVSDRFSLVLEEKAEVEPTSALQARRTSVIVEADLSASAARQRVLEKRASRGLASFEEDGGTETSEATGEDENKVET